MIYQLLAVIFDGVMGRQAEALLYAVHSLPPLSKAARHMVGPVPWPGGVTSWEPQKAKAEGKTAESSPTWPSPASDSVPSKWPRFLTLRGQLSPPHLSALLPSILQVATGTFGNSRAPKALPINPQAP